MKLEFVSKNHVRIRLEDGTLSHYWFKETIPEIIINFVPYLAVTACNHDHTDHFQRVECHVRAMIAINNYIDTMWDNYEY
jgi:hypothetical protein